MNRKGQRGDLRGISRTPSKRKQKGDVLSRSTFANASYDGWRDHYNGTEATGSPFPPLSLTRFPTYGGSNYALKISSADRDFDEIPANNQRLLSAEKNLSRFFAANEVGLISYSAAICVVTHGAVWPAHLVWGISIDTQLWDGSDRSLFKAEVLYPDASAGDGEWGLYDNSNSRVVIPGLVTKRHTAGLNQNKWNWNYVELIIDLSQNGGRGAYHGLQINDVYVDLTDPAVWPDPTQSGQTAVQGGAISNSTSQHQLDFRGGFNLGVYGSPANSATQGFDLILGAETTTIYEAD